MERDVKAIDPRANRGRKQKTEDRGKIVLLNGHKGPKTKNIYLSNLNRIIHTSYILNSF